MHLKNVRLVFREMYQLSRLITCEYQTYYSLDDHKQTIISRSIKQLSVRDDLMDKWSVGINKHQSTMIMVSSYICQDQPELINGA